MPINRVAGDMVEIYGFLNKHCPYIGYFHYSPAQSRNLNLFFADNVISTEEMERRKRIRNHPFTGCFHFAPGKYSDLHDLRRYRRASSPRAEHTIADSSMDKFDAFMKRVSKERGENDEECLTLESTKSRDDSAISTKRQLPRCLSAESGLKSPPRYYSSFDVLDQNLSHYMLNIRKYGTANGEVNSDSDPSHLSSRRTKRFQRLADAKSAYQSDVRSGGTAVPIIAVKSDSVLTDRDATGKDRSGSFDRRHVSPPPSTAPVLSRSPSSKDLAYLTPGAGGGSAMQSDPNAVPRIQLTEPKGSWQVHHDEGVSGFSYDQNRIKDRIRNRFVDKYTLHVDKVMGEGSYAKVVLATNRQTDTFVAVKIINKPAHNSREEEIRFRNEIDNQSRLWHHNICSVLDVYESQSNIYMVLDYCPGGTLEQILELRRRLDEEETRFIAYQLFSGMAYMHENGVLHGDIKPGNIIFQPPSSSDPDGNSAPASRVDLLYEKKRREGTLTISLNQAPVVDYDAVKRNGSEGQRAEEALAQSALDMKNDAQMALLRERVVKGGDIMSVGGPTKARRARSVTSADDEPQLGGGALGFATAAHRNQMRKTKNLMSKRNDSVNDLASLDTSLKPEVSSSPLRTRTYSRSDSGSGGIEVDERFQGHIRYKCPYGMLLKLCDFGLSQKIPDVKHFRHTGDVHKAPYTPGGTEGYLAPEVVAHKPYGIAADLWAAGTVLYKCLCGSLPFVPPAACLERDVKFNGVAWRKVSEPCKALIKSLLTVDEGARMSAKQCLNHAWFADILLISHVIIPEIMEHMQDQDES